MANLSVKAIISDGFAIGVKNAASLIGATVLWILTIWIPYINVGTTIAMCSIPVALSKGKVLYPTFIFDSQYRKQMGDYFILQGLSTMAIILAAGFGIIPAFVLSYSWSQAIYLLLDKEITSTDALTTSNKLTYGHKWTLFGVDLLISILVCLAFLIFGGIATKINGTFGIIVMVIIVVLVLPFSMGCHGIIYKQLTEEPAAEPAAEPAPEVAEPEA